MPSSTTLGSSSDGQSKVGSGETRHDLEPLTKRFPVLAGATDASWLSGELEGSAPGPTTYWIDAVVTVPEATASTLLATDPAPATTTPEVVTPLAGSVPDGLRTSSALDDLFAQGDFRGTAWVTADGRTVVLTALGR